MDLLTLHTNQKKHTMPVTKNATIRYKFIDDLLSDRHHHYTMANLTEKVNDRLEDLGFNPVTKRCIEKDVDFLKERPFCAQIETFKLGGKDCYRYKKSGYSIFNHELSREEMSILYEVLNTVGQFKGLPNFAWLNGLRKSFGMKKHRSVLSFAHNPLLKNSNIMASLYDIVANQQVIKMTYMRFTDADAEVYSIHPYLLKQYNNRWYLVGLRPDRGHIYTLPIDRIVDFEPLPDEKFIQYDGNIEDHFEHVIGITVFDNSKPEDIYFWISDLAYPYYITKPIHHSQETLDEETASTIRKEFDIQGGKIMHLFCSLNYEIEQELARNFQNIIILKPTFLRNSFIDKVNEMHNNYMRLNSHLSTKDGFEPVK